MTLTKNQQKVLTAIVFTICGLVLFFVYLKAEQQARIFEEQAQEINDLRAKTAIIHKIFITD